MRVSTTGPRALEAPSTPPRTLKRIGLVAGYFLLAVGGIITAVALLVASWAGGLVWFFLLSLITVGMACLAAGVTFVFHLGRSLRGIASAPIALPSPWWFVAAVPLLIAAGEWQLLRGPGPGLAFALTIIAGSAAAETAALAYLLRQTGPGSTWRRVALCVAAGGTLSVGAVLTFGGVVPMTVVALAATLRDLGAQLLRDLAFSKSAQDFGRLFFSDRGLFAVAAIAVAAPIVEEFMKPLGVVLLGRSIGSPREAFLLGASCGAGFAILENILYESVPHPVWGGIVAIRSIGAALHPMGSALVALGWYGVFHGHPGAGARLGGLYLVAVAQHWLWNMASVSFALLLGARALSQGFTLDILGITVGVVLVVFFASQGVAMLGAMRYVGRLVAEVPAGRPVPALVPVSLGSPRGVALVATAGMIVLLPLGAAAVQAFLIYLGQR